MISNTCKYAIKALIYLSLNEKEGIKLGIKQISKDLKIPTPFLGKILQTLAKHKILASTKGPHGGFSLGTNFGEISLYDIVYLIDGDDFFNTCMLGLSICKYDKSKNEICPMHGKMDPVKETIYTTLKEQKIVDIASDLSKLTPVFNL
jgi:Rrf2 family transcriptional regulator, iron-sulfur cluster assembly transcription factor